MRRPRLFPLEDVLLAQLIPGFLFVMGWTTMYEVYHEEGSYFTTLIQEILGSEGLFPYFVILAILMSFPVGMAVDAVRHVVGEVWLELPRTGWGKHRPSGFLEWLEGKGGAFEEVEQRFSLYRHAQATLLIPARTAGNLGLVVLTLTVWSSVKILRMGGVYVFSPLFVIGVPLIGLGLSFLLLVRYATGLGEFHREVHGSLLPSKAQFPTAPATESPAFPSEAGSLPEAPSPREGS
ncbi:MAG TPA: hypothetical protein VLM91_27205 [Candidatus Methylomirabilis sp.]|nr:hypothetical protein [Candidatus Methylomirabilis sp.]